MQFHTMQRCVGIEHPYKSIHNGPFEELHLSRKLSKFDERIVDWDKIFDATSDDQGTFITDIEYAA